MSAEGGQYSSGRFAVPGIWGNNILNLLQILSLYINGDIFLISFIIGRETKAGNGIERLGVAHKANRYNNLELNTASLALSPLSWWLDPQG